MDKIKIHVWHTGRVHVSPALPFGGDCCIIKASGLLTPKKDWIWLPVSAYLIEHPKGLILFDTGWNRTMSPDGILDKKAEIRSLGSRLLYMVNQGEIAKGEAVDEQLSALGLSDKDLDYVVLSHLDCDHANGLKLVENAKNIMVSRAEMDFATEKNPICMIRYQKCWWNGVPMTLFDWNSEKGPFKRSFDLFGDGSVMLINIPGHCDGLCAMKITNSDGKFVLLYADGGYGTKSWKEMIVSGIAVNREQQYKSLEWIREQSLDANCIESIATHDVNVKPHIIVF